MPAFDPSVASAAKQQAALLRAAQDHLGVLLAELYVAMPSLAACGFKASFGKRLLATASSQQVSLRNAAITTEQDATSFAVAAMTRSIGVDTQALHTLVTAAREALAQIT